MSESEQDRFAEAHAANLLLLTFNAGMLDGLSYLRAHVFTANMTGNTVLLGVHLVQHDFADAGRSLLSLAAFAGGCILAAAIVLKRETPERPNIIPGLSLELIFLMIFAALGFAFRERTGHFIEGASIVAAAVSLGVQSVTIRRLSIAGVATTFMTGTVTTTMVKFVSALQEKDPSEKEAKAKFSLLLVLLWFAYLAAAAVATILEIRASIVASLAPALIVLFVIWHARRSGNVS